MSKKAKILVADDDPILLKGLQDILSEKYEVIKAINGQIALNLLKQKPPVDLAILDIMMPKMDGYEVAKQMDKQNIDIPYIFLTAKAKADDIIQGLKLGADDYITKPFVEEELMLRISRKLFNQEKVKLRNKRLELIHHNMITPVGVIQGFLSLLTELRKKCDKRLRNNQLGESSYILSVKDIEDFKKRFYDIIEPMYQATEQLSKTIRKFVELQVYSILDLQLLYTLKPLDKLIYDAVSQTKLSKLQCHISNSIPKVTLNLDQDKINEVFFELLDNAFLHNNQPTAIVEIDARKEENYVIISFKDNGRGIPSDDFQNIFKEFWTGYDKINHTRGEGIGLWLCKKYITAHKGEIWVEQSKVDKGTIFSFSLPR